MSEKLTATGKKALLAPFRWIFITGLIYFISAGNVDHPRVWIYVLVYAFGSAVISAILYLKIPALMNDRGEIQKGSKPFDTHLIISYFAIAILILPGVAGVDYRFKLTQPLPYDYLYIGIAIYVLSAIVSVWPMLYNPFFEGTLRLQTDKNHSVIKTGPYKLIRHPGYLGMLIGSLPLPFAFGSTLSFLPAAVMVVLVLVRTHYEDKILIEELDGYAEYAKAVKYRLIPFLW